MTVTRYAAFLRGINVGGNQKVPMADLRDLLAQLRYESPRTLLNSGNAVFAASEPAGVVKQRIEAALGERFGFTPSVVVRTSAELQAVIDLDPFGEIAAEPKWYLVGFSATPIDPCAFDQLDPEQYAPEQWLVDGRELYVWLPNSVGTSKLMAKLPGPRRGVDITTRNWNTLLKVKALLDAVELR